MYVWHGMVNHNNNNKVHVHAITSSRAAAYLEKQELYIIAEKMEKRKTKNDNVCKRYSKI